MLAAVSVSLTRTAGRDFCKSNPVKFLQADLFARLFLSILSASLFLRPCVPCSTFADSGCLSKSLIFSSHSFSWFFSSFHSLTRTGRHTQRDANEDPAVVCFGCGRLKRLSLFNNVTSGWSSSSRLRDMRCEGATGRLSGAGGDGDVCWCCYSPPPDAPDGRAYEKERKVHLRSLQLTAGDCKADGEDGTRGTNRKGSYDNAFLFKEKKEGGERVRDKRTHTSLFSPSSSASLNNLDFRVIWNKEMRPSHVFISSSFFPFFLCFFFLARREPTSPAFVVPSSH